MRADSQSKTRKQNRWLFPALFVVIIAAVLLLFNIISRGRFLESDNLMVILSHLVYPSFIAWGFCFLFACGYTDMSIGGVVVLGSFSACAFGNAIGVPGRKIMQRHILPNCLPSLLVLFTLNIPASILTESSLSFLGLGIQPPNASWGLMINAGRQYLYNAPWLCFAPGAAIMLIVLAFNFLGNGLLDVLDPRQKKG